MSERRPRHPALVARIVTLGASMAAALGLVGLFARNSQQATAVDPGRLVEVRIGDEVGDDEARRAVEAWLEGQTDLTTGGDLTVVDLPPDTMSEPS
ncbi:MAG: hypothetical protein AAF531_15900 [Actinomycetota bacterium]